MPFFSVAHSEKCKVSFFSLSNQERLSYLKTILLRKNGTILQKWIDQKGYILFADQHFDGNMRKAFVNVSAVLSKSQFKELGWQQFQGTTKELQTIRSLVLGSNGHLFSEYVGPTGYITFANQHFDGDMRKAFINTSAVLSKSEFKELDWQQFKGSAKEFKQLRSLILGENGNPRPEYIGQTTGYVIFANQHFDGDMAKAFVNASALLSKSQFEELDWQQFQGTTSEFRKFPSLILDSNDNLFPEYIGQTTGYVLFSDQHFNGNMRRAFINASATLSRGMFMQLGWQQFQGTTKEFKQLLSLILDSNGNLLPEYIGQTTGYIAFANQHFDGDMRRAFINASATLSRGMFMQLGWQQFQGTTKEFKQLFSLILDQNGNPRLKYIGPTGYIAFANQHFNGNMRRTFVNISALLSKNLLSRLQWKSFYGTTDQFQDLYKYFQTHQLKDYKGRRGQRKIAQLIFKGDLLHTYRNTSSLREYLFDSSDVFTSLRESGWAEHLK